MARLVLTVIGDDRAGLVQALADVVSAHDGNWEQGQMAELAGKFAGIVVVTVPATREAELRAALGDLDGLLEIAAHPGSDAEPDHGPDWRRLTLDLLGNDHPGIVRDVSTVLGHHGLTIETINTRTREAPMAGGLLFEAHVVVGVPPATDLAALRGDLEHLATELLVDLDLQQA
jgi:glycine cleavage system regulatory protein